MLETHLFDFDQQCYGRLIRVEFLPKLRDEEKYDGLAALTAAIDNDEQRARGWFRERNSGAVSATTEFDAAPNGSATAQIAPDGCASGRPARHLNPARPFHVRK